MMYNVIPVYEQVAERAKHIFSVTFKYAGLSHTRKVEGDETRLEAALKELRRVGAMVQMVTTVS